MENNFPRNDNNHTKEYLQDIKRYEKKIISNNLPVIYSLKHFSLMIDIPYYEVIDIINNTRTNYRSFMLKKKHGGFREIDVPSDKLKFIQRTIYENILTKVQLDNSCFGFRKGLSIKDNAKNHINKDFVLKIDLFRFFDSISDKRVFGIFKYLGYHPNLAFYLAQLTTNYPERRYWDEIIMDKDLPEHFPKSSYARLPQGAPTSPALSNIIALKMDIRMRKLAEKLNISYTRYADDLTFSGEYNKMPSINVLNKIIEEEGFFINKSKTRIQYKGQKQNVTGLSVINGVHVLKSYKQDIIKHLYFCKKRGVLEHLTKIEKLHKSSFKDWLLGKIFFVYSIERDVGEKFLQSFNEIDWSI